MTRGNALTALRKIHPYFSAFYIRHGLIEAEAGGDGRFSKLDFHPSSETFALFEAAEHAMCATVGSSSSLRQWVRCEKCTLAFPLAITIPCPLDEWLAVVRAARCAACGSHKDLFAYEPGREP